MAIVSKSDVILFDFTLRDRSGAVYDTTNAEQAAKAGMPVKDNAVRPVLVVAGEGQLLPGLDEKVVGATEGQLTHVDVTPDKAFGPRREDLIRVMPLSEFTKRDMTPVPGMVLEIDNQKAKIQSVNGGRVRVDFNHELAGQILSYDFTVVKILKTPAEKIQGLSDDLFVVTGPNAAKAGKIKTALDAATGVVTLSVPADFPKDANFALSKMRFAEQTFRLVKEAKTLKVDETYQRPAEEKA